MTQPLKKMSLQDLKALEASLLNEWREYKEDNDRLLRQGDTKGAYEAQKAAESTFEEYIKVRAEIAKRGQK